MAKFPYGKIPAFEGTDKFKLIEGTTIARYREWPGALQLSTDFMGSLILVSSIGTQVKLLGSNAHEVAIVDQWVHFAEHEISAPTQNITGLIYSFYKPFSLEARTKLTTCSDRISDALEVDT